MDKFQDFLQGLATRGGAIFVLTLMVLIFGLLVFHVLHHSDDPQSTTVILSTFSGFCAALLTMLTTQATKTNGNGTAATQTQGDAGK